jgi:hypothetical protein
MKIGTRLLYTADAWKHGTPWRRLPEVEEEPIGVTGLIQIAWRGGHPKYSSLVSGNYSDKVPISANFTQRAQSDFFDFTTSRHSLNHFFPVSRCHLTAFPYWLDH